jgi:hypothetical protein
MFAWARLLFSEAPPHTPLTRYTAWNGLLYILLGGVFYGWPGSAQMLLRAQPFQAGEAGYVRTLGATIVFIGYLYLSGARTGQDRFGAATILGRLLLVPVLLGLLVATGQLWARLGVPFIALDPVLAIGAWIVFARSRGRMKPAA